MIKKSIAVFLTFVMFLSLASVAFATGHAELYTFYGDGMLFKQNEDTILAGTASSGSEITAELYNSGEELVANGKSVTSADGTFTVSFSAPSGSYEKYKIVLENNDTQFAVLENVVFGELWLASGQSNMQYPLLQEKVGAEMYNNGEKLSEWLRVLLVPPVPEYKGSVSLVPAEPQQNIPGACWVTGEDESIYGMSAVAYFFATEMMAELNMPVGVLNVPLGGSVISSWISREAIDGDEQVKNMLVSLGEYYDKSYWNESERSVYYDMTCNYNLKIEALRHFRISGMIWYQGESDVIYQKTPEQYAALFDLMQRSYTKVFDYKNGLLPIVYTQMASYQYHAENGIDLVAMNAGFAEMQKDEADSRAVVSIYDVPLTYIGSAGAIHPECKQEIGERMAYSAKGFVYGDSDTYTAATVQGTEIRDGKIYVTLENVGDGLKADGKTLKGFAIAGADGIYVGAQAEIISSDTVVIYNEKISAPVSASYAYSLGNMRSNLYATENEEFALPVSPFITDVTVGSHYWSEKQWADFDDENIWHLKDDIYTKSYNSWKSENAQLMFDAGSAFSGENGLRVTSDNTDGFSVSPVLTVKNGVNTVRFHDEDYDYSDYGTLSFYVRNNGKEDISFDSLRIYTSPVSWYSPASCGEVVSADGEWHLIELDINSLWLYGTDFGVKYSNDSLENVIDIDFYFSGENADISLDDIRLLPGDNEYSDSSVDITKLSNLIKVVKMFFVSLLEAISELL